MHITRTLHLFAGAGGGILGDILLGHQCVGAVEINPYCQQVLHARQKDGSLSWFPIFGDVREFDGKPWKGLVDVVSGGFPCQDISIAGKGAGIEGKRSGLWSEFARIISEVRPKKVFIENSPMLITRGLDRVLGDLAELGLDAKWGIVSAKNAGANHERKRLWILGYTNNDGQVTPEISRRTKKGSNHSKTGQIEASEFARPGEQYAQLAKRTLKEYPNIGGAGWWEAEPGVGRVADELAHRVDRLVALGNGQVPACYARAWNILNKDENMSYLSGAT